MLQERSLDEGEGDQRGRPGSTGLAGTMAVLTRRNATWRVGTAHFAPAARRPRLGDGASFPGAFSGRRRSR